MFRISPSDARTDLYGIGKGSAQVIDPSIWLYNQNQNREDERQQRAFNQKARQGREEDINSQLSGLNKLAIMDRDRPAFAKSQGELYAYVKDNIDALRNGDSNALIGFQQRIGDIYTRAELSKNTREKMEAIGSQMMSKGFDKFRPEDIDTYESFITGGPNGEFIEDYDTSKIMPKENVNYNERVIKELAPHAQRMATDSPYSKVFTRQQANQLISDDLTDPVLFEQAAYDFNRAEDKLGAKTPIEYYQAKYAPSLIVRDTKDRYYTGFGSDSDKAPKVAGTFVKEGDGKGRFQFEYTNTSDNPFITIKDPRNPNKSLNVKPIAVNLDGRDTKMEAAVQLTEGERKANAEAIANGDRPPYKETVDLNYQQTSDVLNNKFGIKNVFDIEKGSVPKHVTVKYSDVSPKGEYMIKGKSYSLKDLMDMGYTEEQVSAYKIK